LVNPVFLSRANRMTGDARDAEVGAAVGNQDRGHASG
jgi:hypothetical protein